jgi:hypothetical protein
MMWQELYCDALITDEEDTSVANDPPAPTESQPKASSTSLTTPSPEANLNKMNLPALKELCKTYKLMVSGKKQDLIDRLLGCKKFLNGSSHNAKSDTSSLVTISTPEMVARANQIRIMLLLLLVFFEDYCEDRLMFPCCNLYENDTDFPLPIEMESSEPSIWKTKDRVEWSDLKGLRNVDALMVWLAMNAGFQVFIRKYVM